MKPSLTVSLTLLCLSGALAAVALADVDVDVRNGAKIQGTVSEPFATDTYRLFAPAGAKLRLKLKTKKGLDPSFTLRYPPSPDPEKGLTFSDPEPLAASGEHVVEVTGDGGSVGDYALSVSISLPKKTKHTVTLGGTETPIPFSVLAGTVLKVKAKAGKGSSAVPRLLRVEGPDGYRLDIEPVLMMKAASDALGKTELPEDGDYVLYLDDAGDAGGTADVTIGLKQPKPPKSKLDLRGRTIGTLTGERLAVSDVVDDTGGAVGVAFPGDGGPDSVISGANVVVPAGAVTSPTPIIVSTTTDFRPKGDDGGAGPAVFFGPEGLQFQQDVDVTIPFDVAQFEGDLSQLRVYTRDARGNVSLVPGPYAVDAIAGTCTFPVSHFSSFRAARIGSLAGVGELVGVWKQAGLDPEFGSSYIIIREGYVESVFDYPLLDTCFRSGGPISLEEVAQFYEVVNGRLRIVGDTSGVEYVPAKAKNVPKNCEEDV